MNLFNLLSILFLALPQASVIIRASQMEPVILNEIQCNNEVYLNLEELSDAFNGNMRVTKEERFYRVAMNEKSAYLFENSAKIVTDRTYSMDKPFISTESGNCIPYDGVIKLIKFFYDREPDILVIEEREVEFPGLTNIPQKKNHNKVSIIIDAGHGGEDSGTKDEFGIMEKEITLDISFMLGEILEEDGFKVIYTREDDVTLPLPHRVAIANSSGADLLVSIHVNYSRNSQAKGLEVFFVNSFSSDEEANELAIRENAGYKVEGADLVVSNIMNDLNRTNIVELSKEFARQIYLSADSSLKSIRGVKQAPFYILSRTNMPSVLVEVGFLSNKEEALLLEEIPYREQIARVIYEGIKKFVEARGGLLYAEKGK